MCVLGMCVLGMCVLGMSVLGMSVLGMSVPGMSVPRVYSNATRVVTKTRLTRGNKPFVELLYLYDFPI